MKDADLSVVFAALADIERKECAKKAERELAAAVNRERMRQWSPMFFEVCEALKARGMFGKVCKFEVFA